MYNRYVRDQQGVYSRIPEEPKKTPPAQSEPIPPTPPVYGPQPPPRCKEPPPTAESQLLRRLLGKLGMDGIDTGDLLLLLILFLLFSEGDNRDEELMIAIGLLLIL